MACGCNSTANFLVVAWDKAKDKRGPSRRLSIAGYNCCGDCYVGCARSNVALVRLQTDAHRRCAEGNLQIN